MSTDWHRELCFFLLEISLQRFEQSGILTDNVDK